MQSCEASALSLLPVTHVSLLKEFSLLIIFRLHLYGLHSEWSAKNMTIGKRPNIIVTNARSVLLGPPLSERETATPPTAPIHIPNRLVFSTMYIKSEIST